MLFSKEYKLFCPSGMEVTLLETGAAVTGVLAPDRHGAFLNVALPLRGPDDPSLAGVTLAPYAGRIPGGLIAIGGKTVQLSINEEKNQIHGGKDAPVRRPWKVDSMRESKDAQQIVFYTEAPDGLDGFPGNRRFTAAYRLDHSQRLEITLTAETDKPTRVNLSNHAYFNLTGRFDSDVRDHLLEIRAGEVYLNDEAFLMKARFPLAWPLDFDHPRKIGMHSGHEQLDGARGLNHCFILSNQKELPAAVLTDPVSGRRMRLYTDQPCVMVYSGGFLDSPGCAVALEAQEHPESPLASETPTLYPGEIYRRRIVYRFDAIPEEAQEL